MKTVVVASQKGGAGKTTTAMNMAVAASQDGLRVAMVDLDPQRSLRGWWEARDAEWPQMPDTDPAPEQVKAALPALAKHFDILVIDTPPAAPEWLTTVMAEADLVLIPVRPSPHDLRAVGATLRCARGRIRLRVPAVPTPRAKVTDEAARVLAQYGKLAPVNAAMRVIYAETAATGQGVTEASDPKAAGEARELWDYVKGLLNG
ncbi:ParA family protein [Paracoccus cavernae]|uniref:ParA family protein n=1 Tax=Paracoccus cavernae TaxID=1571207 RepID=A0ABT8DC90_9RHOB|nr:ParA family protein [Paracoccus cavernae]